MVINQSVGPPLAKKAVRTFSKVNAAEKFDVDF